MQIELNNIDAQIVLDSINDCGKRITTFAIQIPKFINAEFNTHRVFSRNFSSSRAISFDRLFERIGTNPVIPAEWGKKATSMYASEALSSAEAQAAYTVWLKARDSALLYAKQLSDLGVHKQVVNRIIEPWMYQTGIVTATEWDNFFNLRTAPDAQPEIRVLACKMKELYEASTPNKLSFGQWHIPLVDESDEEIKSWGYDNILETKLMVSVSRCARVSYGLNSRSSKVHFDQDVNLYNRLLDSEHMSPFEHQAYAHNCQPCYNFTGWHNYRFVMNHEPEYLNV